MSEINFVETDAGKISDNILQQLENGVNEPLYPGDERRIFGEALAAVIVTTYNTVNDSCRQKMLRYARGDVLDALGENRDVERLNPTFATTSLRFGITEPVAHNIVIPAGLRVSPDFERYFLTDSTVVLYAGSSTVDVQATAETGGSAYNGIARGEITNIIDVSDVPLIDTVTNITETAGGGDREIDEAYRERIREAENKLSTAGPAAAYKYWALSANSRVSDAVVSTEEETVSKQLAVYGGHAFLGGGHLHTDTLIVKLPDGAPAATPEDYTVEYSDDLLVIKLSGKLRAAHAIDVEIVRTMEGRVKIVPICAGGEIPDEEVLADVLKACSADDVKPLTDHVSVEAPKTESYDIELTYYTTKGNESEVVQNVEGSGGAIDQYIYWQGSTLDQDINPDELRKRILCPDWAEGLIGATRVQITSPQFKELDATTVAKFSGRRIIKHIVKD